MALTVIISLDVFPQKSSFWSRIPESIKSRKVYKRFEWDYKQRAFPYDTIPGTRYRQDISREILKIKYNNKADLDNCEWHSIGPVGVNYDPWGIVTGRIKALAVHPTDPNTIYIGAANGGIWKTTDGGATWLDIGGNLETLSFGAIAIDPNNPETVYAGSGETYEFSWCWVFSGKGLFKSTDGGQNWIKITNGFGEYTHFSDLVVSPYNPNIVLGAMGNGNFFIGDTLPNEGIWKSTDAGITWNKTLDEPDANDILFHPFNQNIVYATIGGWNANAGFYISTDQGNTWTLSNSGLPDPTTIGRMFIDISKTNPNILYAVVFLMNSAPPFNEHTNAYKSVDAGNTWNQISPGIHLGGNNGSGWIDQGYWDLCIAVDPANPNHVLIGNIELHETLNGSVFSPRRPYGMYSSGSLVHVDYHQLVFAPSDTDYLYIGCDGGIFKSTDGGGTATSINYGLETMQFYRIASDPTDPLVLLGGLQDNGTAFTQDGGNTWDHVAWGDGMECFFDYTDTTLAYASMQNGDLFMSFNGGADFTYLGSCGTGSWITPFFMHSTDHTTLYVANRNVFRKSGGGWFTKISNDVVPAPAYVTTMAQSRINPDHMILASGGSYEGYPLTADSLFRVKISIDGGFNWNDVTENIPGEIRWIARVTVDPVDANTMYVLRTGFSTSNKVYKTTDLGITWTNISGDLPDLPCNDIFIDPKNTDHLYVATDLGIYRTTDAGTIWEYQGGGIPFVPVMDFDYAEFGSTRFLRIGTHGRSIYETTLSPLVGIEENTNYACSEYISITNNPNPLGKSTTFSYKLNASSLVTLQVFNSFGQLVAELVNTIQEKGEQQFQWNVGNLQAGIYYYRIQVGSKVGSGKIIKR